MVPISGVKEGFGFLEQCCLSAALFDFMVQSLFFGCEIVGNAVPNHSTKQGECDAPAAISVSQDLLDSPERCLSAEQAFGLVRGQIPCTLDVLDGVGWPDTAGVFSQRILETAIRGGKSTIEVLEIHVRIHQSEPC